MQAWRPYHNKNTDRLEGLRRKTTKLISELRLIRNHLKCGLTSIETRGLFKRISKYAFEDIGIIILCLKQINVLSVFPRQVWTSTASGVRKKLSDKCVTKIFKETKDDFKELNFGSGLISLLKQYM